MKQYIYVHNIQFIRYIIFIKNSLIYKYNKIIHIIGQYMNELKYKVKLKKMFMLKYLNALWNLEFREYWSYYRLKKISKFSTELKKLLSC